MEVDEDKIGDLVRFSRILRSDPLPDVIYDLIDFVTRLLLVFSIKIRAKVQGGGKQPEIRGCSIDFSYNKVIVYRVHQIRIAVICFYYIGFPLPYVSNISSYLTILSNII